jgi:OFA family oxalate/formate antiporter-like MFS transporter
MRGMALGTVPFVILMYYGGGFATMPAFAADYFGPKNVRADIRFDADGDGALASVFGPLLIAHMRETMGVSRGALRVIAIVLVVSVVLPLVVRALRVRSCWLR